MFEDLTFVQMLTKGGYTMLLLIFCSILVLAVVFEKTFLFKKLKKSEDDFIKKLKKAISEQDSKEAVSLCESSHSVLAGALKKGINLKEKSGTRLKDTVLREISILVLGFEKHLGIAGTIGAVAPFIGLFGTVIGIMRAFHDLGKFGVGNPSVVSTGISEALIATAAGLFVAIPSVVLYNYYTRRINRLTVEWESLAEEFAELLTHSKY